MIKSLHKSKTIFHTALRSYKKKKRKLSTEKQEEVKNTLNALQDSLLKKNRKEADAHAKKLESFSKSYLKKNFWEQSRDFIFAIGFALIVALLVRQMWFEFYEIPTGSMRPTLMEKDRLAVSKTAFGINTPLSVSPFYFDPALVKRNGIFIFTVKNMDILDGDQLYFYIFPGKKQYVKRLMGKPGDTLYFYGGQMYGIDKNGHDISSLFQIPQLSKIDHVPFIHLDGKVTVPSTPNKGIYSPAVIYQMNMPVAKMSISSLGRIQSEMTGKQETKNYKYFDLWGFKNYATTRLVSKKDIPITEEIESADLYIEFTHHPDISKAKLERDLYGRLMPIMAVSKSYIPLTETYQKKLFDNLYTARFIVKNGHAFRYGYKQKGTQPSPFSISLPNVPDGTYEFYYGKAYKIGWQGISKELPTSHPLYTFNIERLRIFFNAGIELNKQFLNPLPTPFIGPARYSYFRNGSLYLLGHPIFEKGDPVLENFIQKELRKNETSTFSNPHYAFEDSGPPLKEDGSLDIDFIKTYGLTIPEKHYLALGDNHAMSADSRDFGFVPQGNIRGAPSLIFWPPGSRFGVPNQPPYPFINLPRTVIWVIAAIILFLWWIWHKKTTKLPKKID